MIIDGKKEAALLREEIKKEILSIKEKHNKTPGLSVILIGNFAPSLIYVNNKEKNSRDVGINSEVIRSNVTSFLKGKYKRLFFDSLISISLIKTD